MASNYSYFLSAGFLDELEEEDFEEDFNLAVEEVAASKGVFICPDTNCKNRKPYKTKGGLQRHINKKHTERVEKLVLDNVVLMDLLNKAAEMVSKDECWSLSTRNCVSNCSYIVDGKLFDKVFSICETFHDSDDPEKFFELFFSEITAKANDFFPGLPLAPATTVMMQLGETVFSYLKFGDTSTSGDTVTTPISKCEIDALQYLSGYVVHKFLKKTKNNSKYNSKENQAIIVILESMVDKTRELTLVDSKTRGGLTSISEDCEQLFYRTEEAFREKTSVPNLRSIDIVKITVDLMSQADIISIVNSISEISGCIIDPEVKKNLFEKMIQLYLRVRSFSFTRDITSQKRKASTATKGLRKELKKKQT